jgi:hypothetical protein
LTYSFAAPFNCARTLVRIMDTSLLSRSPWLAGPFVAAALLFAAPPARAEARPQPPAAAPAFAEVSLKQFFTSSNSRDRIIQLCVLCMMFALFILLKKFAPDAPQRRARGAGRGTRTASEFRAPSSEFRAERDPSRKS